MADEKTAKTGELIRCSNLKCRQLIYASDLKLNGAMCPYCGETAWEIKCLLGTKLSWKHSI